MADDNDQDDDLRPEYRRVGFPAGLERGKYAARMAEGSNIVCIDPELSPAFPDSAAGNEALRTLLQIAERSVRKPRRVVRNHGWVPRQSANETPKAELRSRPAHGGTR